MSDWRRAWVSATIALPTQRSTWNLPMRTIMLIASLLTAVPVYATGKHPSPPAPAPTVVAHDSDDNNALAIVTAGLVGFFIGRHIRKHRHYTPPTVAAPPAPACQEPEPSVVIERERRIFEACQAKDAP